MEDVHEIGSCGPSCCQALTDGNRRCFRMVGGFFLGHSTAVAGARKENDLDRNSIDQHTESQHRRVCASVYLLVVCVCVFFTVATLVTVN